MKNERYKSFTNGKESYSSFLVPDFVDIQRKSFFHLLEKGILEEFSKINPIVSNISQLRLTFYPEKYLLILPDFSLSEAIVQGKTYSCKLYVPVLLAGHKAAISSSVYPVVEEGDGNLRDNVTPSSSMTLMKDGVSLATPGQRGAGQRALSFSKKSTKYQEKGWEGVAPKNIYVTNRTYEQMLFEEDQSATSRNGSDRVVPDDTKLYTSWKSQSGDVTETQSGLGRKEIYAFTPSKRRTPLIDGNSYTPSVTEFRSPLIINHTAKISDERRGFVGHPRPTRGWPRSPIKRISLNGEKRATQRTREGTLSWVLLGNLPLMTKRGHFVINGSPRVLVNQLTRCPGIYFHERRWGVGKTEKRLVYADFVSRRGAWLRLQADKAGEVWARLKRTPKVPFALFYQSMIACECNPLQWTASDQDTLIEMYEEVNPTKRESSAEGGKAFLDQKFKNPRTYDLGVTGRDQLNIRFGTSIATQQLTSKDLYYAFEQIKELQNHRIFADDIDNLSNRRVRAAGDLVQGQFETGLYRLEKVVLAKMRKPIADVSCKTLLTSKPLNGALREFFGSSPLSQYMDQTNPLAEITQKRRVSSLGPGGISRETAGMAIRGIHPTHYGRICPIETPEGKNAGLVNSLTAFTQVREDGTLESPYYLILQGQVQNEGGFRFLPVEEEEQHSIKIAPGDVKVTDCRFLPSNLFPIREAGNPQEDFRHASREMVNVMAVSPIQMISIATSLIPFLEHDDANRALMGSNMQRQAVPLLRPERPIVGTGLEALVVAASGHAVESQKSGYVSFVSNEQVMIYSKSFIFNKGHRSCSPQTKIQKETDKGVTDQLDTHSYIGGNGESSRKGESNVKEMRVKADPIRQGPLLSQSEEVVNGFRRGVTPSSSMTLMLSKIARGAMKARGGQQTPTSCSSGGRLKRIWVHNLRAKGPNSLLKSSFSFADSPQLAILRSVHQPFSVLNPTWGKDSHQNLSTQSLNHQTRNQLLYQRGLEYWKGLEFNKIEYKGNFFTFNEGHSSLKSEGHLFTFGEGVNPLLSQREGNLFKVTSLLSVKETALQRTQDRKFELEQCGLLLENLRPDINYSDDTSLPSVKDKEPNRGLQHLLTASLQANWGITQSGLLDSFTEGKEVSKEPTTQNTNLSPSPKVKRSPHFSSHSLFIKSEVQERTSSIGKGRLEASIYPLQSYCRSNQETCLNHAPAVTEGEWIQEGDLVADCSASHLGELALGKNVCIAYLPWEGYNFEDAVVISERLVLEDVYTSIHIQKYEVETKETKFGFESITRDVPGLDEQRQARLDKYGVAIVGSWVKEGDILVGKVSPKGLQPLSPYERLAYDIANVEAATMEDTSLRVPKGVEGRVINYHAYNDTSSLLDVFEPSLRGALPSLRGPLGSGPLKEPNDLSKTVTGCPGRVRIYLAEERRIQVGDKVAGRHGNKGIVSTILPRQDMPYLPDGQIVDVVLNPLGIPSRMNVGQVFECLLGLAGMQLGQHFQVTPFDEVYGAEASRSLVYLKLYQARLRTNQNWIFDFKFPGKVALFDGRTGQLFDQWVTVGQAYMLKLVHLVDEKIHARSTGPYSLVTKQPLGGRSKHGGQRLGEMEVWALEGFGAAYILQEMLTSKSDDVVGREQAVEAILFKGKMSLGNPEAFKVLVRELQSLCLDVGVYAISSNRLHREVIDVGSIL